MTTASLYSAVWSLARKPEVVNGLLVVLTTLAVLLLARWLKSRRRRVEKESVTAHLRGGGFGFPVKARNGVKEADGMDAESSEAEQKEKKVARKKERREEKGKKKRQGKDSVDAKDEDNDGDAGRKSGDASSDDDSKGEGSDDLNEGGADSDDLFMSKYRKAVKNVAETLTPDQKEEEAEVRRKQLEKIFELMKAQEQKFGVQSLDDVQDQMRLYSF